MEFVLRANVEKQKTITRGKHFFKTIHQSNSHLRDPKLGSKDFQHALEEGIF